MAARAGPAAPCHPGWPSARPGLGPGCGPGRGALGLAAPRREHSGSAQPPPAPARVCAAQPRALSQQLLPGWPRQDPPPVRWAALACPIWQSGETCVSPPARAATVLPEPLNICRCSQAMSAKDQFTKLSLFVCHAQASEHEQGGASSSGSREPVLRADAGPSSSSSSLQGMGITPLTAPAGQVPGALPPWQMGGVPVNPGEYMHQIQKNPIRVPN